MLQNKPNTENDNKVPSKNSEAHLKSRNGGPSLPLSEVEAAHPLFSPNQGDPLKSKLNLSINSPSTETELKVPPTLVSIT